LTHLSIRLPVDSATVDNSEVTVKQTFFLTIINHKQEAQGETCLTCNLHKIIIIWIMHAKLIVYLK